MKSTVLLCLLISLASSGTIAQDSKVNDKKWSMQSVLRLDRSQVGRIPGVIPPREMTGSNPQAGFDVRVRPTTNTTQSEMSIAVSPVNPAVILASANATDYPVTTIYGAGAYWSTDYGVTWQGFDQPPGGNGNQGDPAAAIDRNGYFYVGSISLTDGQGIMRSTNGGASWNYYQVSFPNGDLLDKNHLTVDNSASSPYQGNLYDAWTDFGQTGAPIEFARSTDHGVTWVNTQNISANAWGQGVNLQTGPTGTVYATWANPQTSSPFSETSLGFNKSTNGGVTWGTPGTAISNIKGIRTMYFPPYNIRVNSFPSMAVSQKTGAIYIVWANVGVPGVNTGDPDIYLIKSVNGGTSWSAPLRINSDQAGNGANQWFPWITVDPVTDMISIIFYDGRNYIGTTTAQVFVAQSQDGGATFSNFVVSDAPFVVGPLPGLSNYNGDYIGIASRSGMTYPCWNSQVPALNSQGWVSPFPYKDHFLSSTPNAIADCSQRKIIRDWSGVYYACYESDGNIWLTKSTDEGLTWWPDLKVSPNDPGFTHRFPCISRNYLGIEPSVLIAWEATGSSGGTYTNKVYLGRFDLQTLAPIGVGVIQQLQAGGAFTTSPVLAPSFGYTTTPTLLAWFDPTGKIWGYVVTYGISAVLWQGNVTPYFSIANNEYGYLVWQYPTWNFAWAAGGVIYRAYCEMTNSQTLSPSSITTFDPGHTTGYNDVSTVRVGDHDAVSWIDNGMATGQGTSSASVCYREFYSGPTTVWPDIWGSVSSPSLTYNSASDTRAIYFQGGNSIRGVTKTTTGSWSPISTVISGTTPSVSVHAPGDAGNTHEVLLSRSLAGPLYTIQVTQLSFGSDGGKQVVAAGAGRNDADVVEVQEGRGGSLLFARGSMHIVILSASIDGTPLDYPPVSSSLQVIRREQIDAAATSLPFAGEGMLDVSVSYRACGEIPGPQYDLQVRDAGTGLVLQTLKVFHGAGETTSTIHLPLHFGGKRVTVGLAGSGMDAVKEFSLEQWMVPKGFVPAESSPLSNGENVSGLPAAIALHQNYPNPFNPTTEIRFDLPTDGTVSLEVFDVLGRKVADLANGYHQAGYHSVTWNASGMASGVYFARFTVANVQGSVAYTRVNKLMLVR